MSERCVSYDAAAERLGLAIMASSSRRNSKDENLSVAEIREKLRESEDYNLALSLQDEEFAQHYDLNRKERRIVSSDTKKSKEEQLAERRAAIEARLKEAEEIAKRDEDLARELERQMLDEERQRALDLARLDEELARRLQMDDASAEAPGGSGLSGAGADPAIVKSDEELARELQERYYSRLQKGRHMDENAQNQLNSLVASNTLPPPSYASLAAGDSLRITVRLPPVNRQSSANVATVFPIRADEPPREAQPQYTALRKDAAPAAATGRPNVFDLFFSTEHEGFFNGSNGAPQMGGPPPRVDHAGPPLNGLETPKSPVKNGVPLPGLASPTKPVLRSTASLAGANGSMPAAAAQRSLRPTFSVNSNVPSLTTVPRAAASGVRSPLTSSLSVPVHASVPSQVVLVPSVPVFSSTNPFLQDLIEFQKEEEGQQVPVAPAGDVPAIAVDASAAAAPSVTGDAVVGEQ